MFSGPYYLAEQLGYRKIVDTTFMIASMIMGSPDEEDLKKFFRALRRAQRDIDLRPDLYTHYYTKEFPTRYHDIMDTRRWGPGERIVFEPYTEEAIRTVARLDRGTRDFRRRQAQHGIGQLQRRGRPARLDELIKQRALRATARGASTETLWRRSAN